jgi:RNA-binding protein Nova
MIIGQSGQNRADLQAASHSQIFFTPKNVFYPGTTDRVLLICAGSPSMVVRVLQLILAKVSPELDRPSFDDQPPPPAQLKLLFPAAVCGIVLGKDGATVKDISRQSCTNVSLSAQDKTRGLDYERVLNITGSLQQSLHAVSLVLERVNGNPVYLDGMVLSLPPPSTALAQLPSQQFVQSSLPAPSTAVPMMPMAWTTIPNLGGLGSGPVEARILVPDSCTGAIIGKGGELLTCFKKLLGIRIHVSRKEGDDSQQRLVTISGIRDAVNLAQIVVNYRLQCIGPNTRPTALQSD